MGWYVNLNGTTLGPVDELRVVVWIEGGQLVSGSVCAVGSQQWIDVAAHPVFAAALRSAAPPPPHPTPNPIARAIGSGLRKTGRWLLLGVMVFFLFGLSGSSAFGLFVGPALIGWGVFGYKRSRRTGVELILGRTKPARWAAGLTVGAGALCALFGISGIGMQREEASRKEKAAAAAEKQAAQDDAHRKELQASLLAAAPGKAAAWRATLRRISSDVTSVKTNDDLHTRLDELTVLRDAAKAWLGQLDTKPPDAAAAESEIGSRSTQIQGMIDFVDSVDAFDGAFQDAKALIAKRSWLDADQALDGALQRVAALQTAAPSYRALVVGGFDPNRKKAEVAATKVAIAGAVAGVKRQQAAADSAEQKRRLR